MMNISDPVVKDVIILFEDLKEYIFATALKVTYFNNWVHKHKCLA